MHSSSVQRGSERSPRPDPGARRLPPRAHPRGLCLAGPAGRPSRRAYSLRRRPRPADPAERPRLRGHARLPADLPRSALGDAVLRVGRSVGARKSFPHGVGRPGATEGASPRRVLRARCAAQGASQRVPSGAAEARDRDAILPQAGTSRRPVPRRRRGPRRAQSGGARRGLGLDRCRARPRGRGARPARRGPVRAILARAPVRRGFRPVLSLLRRPGRRDGPPALSIGAHASRVRPVARVRGGAGGGGGRTSRLHLHRRLGARATHGPRHHPRHARLSALTVRGSSRRDARARPSARRAPQQAPASDGLDLCRRHGIRGSLSLQAAADPGAGDLDRFRSRHLLAGGLHLVSRVAAHPSDPDGDGARGPRQVVRAVRGGAPCVHPPVSPRPRRRPAPALPCRRGGPVRNSRAPVPDAGRHRFAHLRRSVAPVAPRPGVVPPERGGSQCRARLGPSAASGSDGSGSPARPRSVPGRDRVPP